MPLERLVRKLGLLQTRANPSGAAAQKFVQRTCELQRQDLTAVQAAIVAGTQYSRANFKPPVLLVVQWHGNIACRHREA